MGIQPKLRAFCWNELQTTDVLKAQKFYGNLLGWSFKDHSVGATKYTMINLDNNDIGGIVASSDKNNSSWTSYIAVDDIDATVAKVKDLGGNVLVPITTLPDAGMFAIISDPTGAKIALWQTFLD